MRVSVTFHPDFQLSLARLAVYNRAYALDVRALVGDYISRGIPVPEAFDPHPLVHRRGMSSRAPVWARGRQEGRATPPCI